jgi:hypothetical protein
MVPFAKNSLTNGFELILDVESYDYAVSSTGSEGIVLSILHQASADLNSITHRAIETHRQHRILSTKSFLETKTVIKVATLI